MTRVLSFKPVFLTLAVAVLAALSFQPAQGKTIFDALPHTNDSDVPFYMEFSASSTLPPSKTGNYEPGNVDDDDPGTAWVEGAKGHGVGEWIQVEFTGEFTEVPISKIGIISGYAKGERFKQNNRIKKAQLVFSNGRRVSINLKDTAEMQYFSFEPVLTDKVKLVIEDVYPGTKWDDTCISEIEFHVPDDFVFKVKE